jgi:hypothetical protein
MRKYSSANPGGIMKMVKSDITEKLGEEGGSGFKCLFFPTLAGVAAA